MKRVWYVYVQFTTANGGNNKENKDPTDLF